MLPQFSDWDSVVLIFYMEIPGIGEGCRSETCTVTNAIPGPTRTNCLQRTKDGEILHADWFTTVISDCQSNVSEIVSGLVGQYEFRADTYRVSD